MTRIDEYTICRQNILDQLEKLILMFSGQLEGIKRRYHSVELAYDVICQVKIAKDRAGAPNM